MSDLSLPSGADAEHQQHSQNKEGGAVGKRHGGAEGGPQGADHDAGEEVAEAVDGGEDAEGGAVVFLADEFGAEGVFQSFRDGHEDAGEGENAAKGPDIERCKHDEQGHGGGQRVAAGEDEVFGEMIGQPAGDRGERGIESVAKQVKAHGETGGWGGTECRGEFLRGQQDEQGGGKIAGTEQADGGEESAVWCGQGAQLILKGNVRYALAFLFLHQESDYAGGEQAGNEGGQKDTTIIVREQGEQEQGGGGTGDGADGVHHALKPEGAAVGFLGDGGGEEGFADGGADAASQPGEGAGEQNLPGGGGEGEGGGAEGGHEVTGHGDGFAIFEFVRVIPGAEFGEA